MTQEMIQQMTHQERLNFMKTYHQSNTSQQKQLNLQHKEYYTKNSISNNISNLEATISKLEIELNNTQNTLQKTKEESKKKDTKIGNLNKKVNALECEYSESQKKLNKLEQITSKGNVDIKSMKTLFDREMQNVAAKLRISNEEVDWLTTENFNLKQNLEEEVYKNDDLNEKIGVYKINQKDIIKYQKENSMYKSALQKQIKIDTTNNATLMKEFTNKINRQVEENVDKHKQEEILQLKKEKDSLDKTTKQLQETLRNTEFKLSTSSYESDILKKNYETERHKNANIANQLETLRKKNEKLNSELELSKTNLDTKSSELKTANSNHYSLKDKFERQFIALQKENNSIMEKTARYINEINLLNCSLEGSIQNITELTAKNHQLKQHIRNMPKAS